VAAVSPLFLNLTAADRDVFVISTPGIIAYTTQLEFNNTVVLVPINILELDIDGAPVAAFDSIQNIPLLNATSWLLEGPFLTDEEGVLASSVNLSVTLQNGAQLVITVLLFEEDGIVSSALDHFNVTAGTLKVRHNHLFCVVFIQLNYIFFLIGLKYCTVNFEALCTSCRFSLAALILSCVNT
jgi:hypothetical protein